LQRPHTGLRFAPQPPDTFADVHAALYGVADTGTFASVARKTLEATDYPFTDLLVLEIETLEEAVLARMAEDAAIAEARGTRTLRSPHLVYAFAVQRPPVSWTSAGVRSHRCRCRLPRSCHAVPATPAAYPAAIPASGRPPGCEPRESLPRSLRSCARSRCGRPRRSRGGSPCAG